MTRWQRLLRRARRRGFLMFSARHYDAHRVHVSRDGGLFHDLDAHDEAIVERWFRDRRRTLGLALLFIGDSWASERNGVPHYRYTCSTRFWPLLRPWLDADETADLETIRALAEALPTDPMELEKLLAVAEVINS